MTKKNVRIAAEVVNVSNTKTKKKAGRVRKRSKGAKTTRNSVPAGVSTGLSGLTPGPAGKRGFNEALASWQRTEGFSEQSSSFIELYCDPCGEHCQSLDAGKPPDGTLQTSTAGFVRAVDTLQFPWQLPSEDDISGKVYSMLFLQLPTLRSVTFILAHQLGEEFDEARVNAFCKSFSNLINREDAFYPNFVQVEPYLYWTAIDTAVLRSILPPNEAGVSSTISSYRFSSQGLTIYFNTPDLLNQGTFNSMRYPLDMTTKDLTANQAVVGSDVEYLQWRYITQSIVGGVVTASVSFVPNLANNDPFPVYSGNVVTNNNVPTLISVPLAAVDAYRNYSGTFNVAVGNLVAYRIVGNVVSLFNQTTGASLQMFTLDSLAAIGTARSGFNRLYVTGGVIQEEILKNDVTIVSLPPLTQADMFQQNVKCTIRNAKETNGVYLPGCIAQPILNVTHASSYRKVILTTKTTELKDLVNNSPGWGDTIDLNFMVSVINFQSIPYACKPLVKACRSVEFVPSPNSILGLFVTGCPPAQPEALEVCKAFTDNQPHGYPAHWNGMGVLFGKVLQMVERIPMMLRAGHNIYREVKTVCDKEAMQLTDNSADELLSRGFKRLMRI